MGDPDFDENSSGQVELDTPLAELVLHFSQLDWEECNGEKRVVAQVVARYETVGGDAVESIAFAFRAPTGSIDARNLRWYLEDFYIWPVGVFRERAARIEALLPEWGRALYQATLGSGQAREILQAWRTGHKEQRISIALDPNPPIDLEEAAAARYRSAASCLLGLPWELLRDEDRYLFLHDRPVRVRRRLPDQEAPEAQGKQVPIRVLLISPRPDDKIASYIDHRASALPLVQAVSQLGGLVELKILHPPTFKALEQELKRAHLEGTGYHILHFDGHGIFLPKPGRGYLCFEKSDQEHRWSRRASDLIHAVSLGKCLANYQIPVVILEACQSAKSEQDVIGSVAGRLLLGGVRSVVAMSHSVMVVTAVQFVDAFYQALAKGERIGTAMVRGQQSLMDKSYRFEVESAGSLHLHDWFVPVLYQAQADPRLFTKFPTAELEQPNARREAGSLGQLPQVPSHGFLGRSRDLLTLERMMQVHRHVTILGQGGAGKTSLACELARWLVASQRFEAVVFVSLEVYSYDRAVLDSLGKQLVSVDYSVAFYGDDEQAAMAPLRRALNERPTLIVLDNFESILPAPGQDDPEASEAAGRILEWVKCLADGALATRLLFTSRECLPLTFAKPVMKIDPLNRSDAIRMLSAVLSAAQLEPSSEDPGRNQEELELLVDAMGCHARALVLLAPEVALRGVKGTLTALKEILETMPRGDRENSLYASIELSLKRLPSWIRQAIAPLALVHGGCHAYLIGELLGLDEKLIQQVGEALVAVSLAQDCGDGFLLMDPALPSFLVKELDPESHRMAEVRWCRAMSQFMGVLYQDLFDDAERASRLAQRNQANFLDLVENVEYVFLDEERINMTHCLERLFAHLGQDRYLARVINLREHVSSRLQDWSHAVFLAEDSRIDRLMEKGDIHRALASARSLQKRCEDGGREAFVEAAYDSAMVALHLGNLLGMVGQAEEALAWLEEARVAFAVLASQGEKAADHMANTCLTSMGGRLRAMGRLEEAAAVYEQAIAEDLKQNWTRDLAVDQGNLGTVRLLQRRFDEAAAAWQQARLQFESMQDDTCAADAWHQLGMIHEARGKHEQSEKAYLSCMAIRVRSKDKVGEASCQNQLGLHFLRVGRMEDAVKTFGDSAIGYNTLGDLANESLARNNLAGVLIRLARYDEARSELTRVIQIMDMFNHVSAPWKVWAQLADLEDAVQEFEAAGRARVKAREAFLAYRRKDGENHTGAGQLCRLVLACLKKGEHLAAEQSLDRLEQLLNAPRAVKVFLVKLRSILAGDGSLSLADDPGLTYDMSVELQLLLEECSQV